MKVLAPEMDQLKISSARANLYVSKLSICLLFMCVFIDIVNVSVCITFIFWQHNEIQPSERAIVRKSQIAIAHS